MAFALALAGTVAACDSGTGTTSTGAGGSTSVTTTTATASTTVATTASTTSSSSTGGGAPTFVAHLDAAQGQLPEGLMVAGQEAYVGLAPLGKMLRIDLPGGAVHDFGSIPTPSANNGFLLGIVVDATGNAYVGFGNSSGTPVKNGVYKIPAAGGSVTAPFATHPEMNFPNGLWLDATNDIFVADSGGAIFDIKPNGTTTKWTSDPSLVGTDVSCKNGAPFALGANGIVRIANDFYVSNTNLGSIVKIPIQTDGSAGTASVLAGPDCNLLGGVDGIAVAPDGTSILAVSNAQSALLKIDSKGAVSTVFTGKPLDNPASIVVQGKTAYITNSAFFDMTAPAPGLLSLQLP